jgi:predicted nuclease of predicted toxin-antitoxin system
MLPGLLADENIPMPVIEVLRVAGHDVLSIRESAPGSPDEAVLRLAVAKNRILVTFDRDYGELVFGMGLEPPPSIIYLRFAPASASAVSDAILSLLADPGSVVGSMVIVSRQGIRQRRFRREPH